LLDGSPFQQHRQHRLLMPLSSGHHLHLRLATPLAAKMDFVL
jgi:hypothetical protein